MSLNIMTFDEFSKDLEINERKIRGDKIKIDSIVGKTCIFGPFQISKSHFNEEYLQMQVEVEGSKRCVFTGSKCLIKLIKSSMDKNGIDHHDFYDVRFEGRILEEVLSNGTRAYRFSN